MDQLTQAEAERCARACEMPLLWFNKEHLGDLSPDPYYWFPRLWERYRDDSYAVNVARSLVILLCATGSKELPEVCLWLCAAIEALEKEGT